MEFPRSLAPWAHLLKIFPRELSLALGPAVHRLASAIGPLHSPMMASAGDPDGFDDLARRGAYERLLTTEWLLADEVPDEFARRAAMGEHLFLRIARRNPSASRVSLALFDAGPNQLGAPRLAHLAALVVFTRRAEAVGAKFGWATLQQTGAPIFSGLDTAEVMRLLEARTVREIDGAQIESWLERVADWQELDDLWFIGGERMKRWLPAGTSHIEVRDAFDLDARRLALTIRGATSAVKAFTLDIPDEQACARLLRDPFNLKPSAPPFPLQRAFVPLSNLVFDATGAKLFARSSHERVIAFPVPNSPFAGTGGPKLYSMRNGETITAIGRSGKALCQISTQDKTATIEYRSNKYTTPPAGEYKKTSQDIPFSPTTTNSPLQACYRLPQRGGAVWAFVDNDGSLYELANVKWSPQQDAGSVSLHAVNVRAATLYHSRVIYVGQELSDEKWVIAALGEKAYKWPLRFSAAPLKAFFGFGGAFAHHVYGLIAALEDEQKATIIYAQGELQVTVSPDERIVGVIHDSQIRWPALVVVAADQRTLLLVSKSAAQQDTRRTLLVAPADIHEITVSVTAPHIAYSTINGDVIVESLTYQKPLCRFSPRGSGGSE